MNNAMKKPGAGRTSSNDYATIYRLVQHGRGRPALMARVTGMRVRTVNKTAFSMWSLGMIYPARWDLHVSRYAPYWRVGNAPAAIHPTRGVVTAPARSRLSELTAFASFLDAAALSSSTLELAAESGLSRATTGGLIKHCRAIGLMRIGGYQVNNGGDHTPLYVLGCGDDAPRPPARPKIELDRAAAIRRRDRMSTFDMVSRLAASRQSAA